MKRIYFLAATVLTVITGFSQTQEGYISPDLNEAVLRVNFLGVPAFGFEKGLGSNLTIRPEAGLGWPVYVTAKNSKGLSYPRMRSAVNPYLLFELRKYYNLQRRAAIGKKTRHFSGNYTGLFYRYNAYEKDDNYKADDEGLVRDVHCLGVLWGFQKSLWPADIFYINFSVGPGIKTNWVDYSTVAVSVQVGFGMQW
jgi:hypothetical protein